MAAPTEHMSPSRLPTPRRAHVGGSCVKKGQGPIGAYEIEEQAVHIQPPILLKQF